MPLVVQVGATVTTERNLRLSFIQSVQGLEHISQHRARHPEQECVGGSACVFMYVCVHAQISFLQYFLFNFMSVQRSMSINLATILGLVVSAYTQYCIWTYECLRQCAIHSTEEWSPMAHAPSPLRNKIQLCIRTVGDEPALLSDLAYHSVPESHVS
jgi:hypothetical protein